MAEVTRWGHCYTLGINGYIAVGNTWVDCQSSGILISHALTECKHDCDDTWTKLTAA